MALTQLVEILSSTLKSFRGAPGKTVNVKGKGLGGAGIEAEYFQPGGLFHRPVKRTRGILLPLGRSGKASVVINCQNYSIGIDITDGETILYSTDAAGAVKAKIYLNSLGEIELNGNSKQLVTWSELNTALSTLCGLIAAHVHASNGTPSPTLAGLSCNISAAKTTSIKTGG